MRHTEYLRKYGQAKGALMYMVVDESSFSSFRCARTSRNSKLVSSHRRADIPRRRWEVHILQQVAESFSIAVLCTVGWASHEFLKWRWSNQYSQMLLNVLYHHCFFSSFHRHKLILWRLLVPSKWLCTKVLLKTVEHVQFCNHIYQYIYSQVSCSNQLIYSLWNVLKEVRHLLQLFSYSYCWFEKEWNVFCCYRLDSRNVFVIHFLQMFFKWRSGKARHNSCYGMCFIVSST